MGHRRDKLGLGVIVGEQINPDDPPRWISIWQEAGIPGAEGEGGRWSVDNLFLDQYGRPTFVEVKRSSDSRIRREVVGQMLDYAANAQKYLPPGQIKALAAKRYGGDEELDARLSEFLALDDSSDTPADIEAYWDTVEQNLRNGQVRLLFVADQLPSELRRIIEFLNEHMPLVEVLGVEIKQYRGQDIQALVPRIVGLTEFARQQKKSPGKKARQMTKEEFLEACPDKTKEFFNKLISGAEQRGFIISWGTKGFSVRFQLPDGKIISLFYCYVPGMNSWSVPLFQAYLGNLKDPEDKNILLKAYQKHLPFELKGQYTLEIPLDDEGLAKAETGLSEVLDVAQKYIAGDKTEL